MADTQLVDKIRDLAEGDPETINQFLQLREARIEETGLDAKTFDLVRLSALVASGAPPVSWIMNLKLAKNDSVQLEQLQGTLKAIAPLVGTAKVIEAAGNIARGYGISVEVGRAMEKTPSR